MSGLRKDGSTPSHLWVEFTNPYLRCARCGQPVHRWHDDQQCGTPEAPCPVDWYLAPCGHRAEARSACPSWTPADGCTCLSMYGRLSHEEAAR